MIRWEIDDRPPTAWTRAYVRGMWWRRDKEAFEGAEHTLDVARRKQASGDRPPTLLTRVTRGTVSVAADGETRVISPSWTPRDAEMTRVPGPATGLRHWIVAPRGVRPQVRVVYLHGGGYVHPLTADYWRLVRALATAPAEVVVPAYPLAPDATVDDVLPLLLGLLDRPDPLPTVLMGDSAGGALALVLAAMLRDGHGAGSRVDLRGVVLLSPWLDAVLDEADVHDLEPTDPMLAESGLRAAGRWWAGDREPTDPLVSPVNGHLRDLPPLDVFIGERDILRPAVDRLAERAEQDDADLAVHEVPAMFHVWMTRAIPEARRTRAQLVRLLRQRATIDNSAPAPGE